jgi:DNA-binding MltR family transcriptional regulator
MIALPPGAVTTLRREFVVHNQAAKIVILNGGPTMPWTVTHTDEMDAIDELNRYASDRAIGIVVASIVETHLTSLVKSAMVSNPISLKGDPVDKSLFRSSGPIGSFSAKIKLAYLMGLVSEECFRDLENMREIRNRFAQHLDIGSFGMREITDLCMRFTMVDKYVTDPLNGIHGDPSALFALETPDAARMLTADYPRERYLLAGQVFAIGLRNATPNAKARNPHF